MSVGFDASMTGGNSSDGFNQEAAGATSVASASGMTVGGSASLLLGVLVLQSTIVVTSGHAMTWDGVSMTLRPIATSTDGTTYVTVAVFRLLAPTAGAKSLSASWTVLADAYLSCVSFTSTDTTTGTANADDTTATQATTITVPSTTDGATVAVFGVNGSTPTVNFSKIFAEAPLNPGGGASYTLGGTSNAHTFTGAGGTRQALAGVHVLAASSGGRTLFYRSGLDGHSSSGPKQFNPSLGYHRHPAISLESYHREQARKHREFMQKVRAA